MDSSKQASLESSNNSTASINNKLGEMTRRESSEAIGREKSKNEEEIMVFPLPAKVDPTAGSGCRKASKEAERKLSNSGGDNTKQHVKKSKSGRTGPFSASRLSLITFLNNIATSAASSSTSSHSSSKHRFV